MQKLKESTSEDTNIKEENQITSFSGAMDIIHIHIKEVVVQSESVRGGKSVGGDMGLLGSCTVSLDLKNDYIVILISWIRKTKPTTTMIINWMGRLCLWSADVVN